MFITIVVSLYTSRIVLQVLGASDYGLYNVVAGVLAMFGMFNGALTVGTQRYLNFAMGEGGKDKLKRMFSIALGLHLIVSLVILILGQIIGLWFVMNYLNIPEGRLTAAIWVFEFSLVALVVNMIQVPFQSCIIAHEHMNVYAVMSIYDVTVKLLVVILIQYITLDKLILYSALIFIVHFTSVLIYNIYCRKKYEECSFKIVSDKKLMREMASYGGWNLLGGSIGPVTNQGVNILLNIFCGTIVNAARGLSLTVSTYILQFVQSFQLAANPQIVKLFASKEYELFYRLIINNSRVAAYLFLLIAIPAFIEIRFILTIWLGEYPDYTEIFVQIILIQSLFQTLNKPINMSVHASGRIKGMNIINTIFMILVLPACYFALMGGASPVVVYWINVIFFITDNIVCLYYSHKYTNLPIMRIIKDVYFNVLFGALAMFFFPFAISLKMEEGVARFLVVCVSSVIISSIVIYAWGLTPGMRKMLLEKTKKSVKK